MKVQNNMLNIIQDKRDYYARMLNICDSVLQGTPMSDACAENGMTVPTFRNRICRNESKPALYSQQEIISALEEGLSPEERILQEVFKYRPDKSIALIDYPEDFEDTIDTLLKEMDERTEDCMRLYFFENWTYAEIGKKHNLSLESIRRIIHVATRRLRRSDRVLRIIWGDTKYNEVVAYLDSREDVGNIMLAAMRKATESKDSLELYDYMIEWIVSAKRKYYANREQIQDTTDTIDSLDLSTRAYNSLVRRQITHVSQLLNMTDAELLSVRNLGAGTMTEIDRALMKKGFERIHTRS